MVTVASEEMRNRCVGGAVRVVRSLEKVEVVFVKVSLCEIVAKEGPWKERMKGG